MWKMVSPSTFIRFSMPFGVALSAFFNLLTAWTKRAWRSGVHLSRARFLSGVLTSCASAFELYWLLLVLNAGLGPAKGHLSTSCQQ